MKQVHVWISGFVQGVGFRAYVRRQAQKLGLVGWVKNTSGGPPQTASLASGGQVEAVIQGEEKRVKQLQEICRRGPMLASVEHVEVKDETPEVFNEFVIRH